jgi:exopolysaccharide production protein ExoZ
MVAFAHLYGIDQRFLGGAVLPAAAQLGFAGVDLFFVLSGFVMVHVTRFGAGQPVLIPAFLFARLTRIYPLWWLVLGAVTVVWFIRPDMVFASVAGTPNLLADFALVPHERLPLLAVGWTLIHEVYFYLAFAALMVLPLRLLPLGILAWMLCAAVGNVWLRATGAEPSPLLGILTHPLTLEFGLGAAVGLLAGRGERPVPLFLITAGVIWMVGAGFIASERPVALFDDGWTRVLSFGPAWALVVWGMVGHEVDRWRIPLRPLAGLGEASYALYLIHVPVFAVGARLIAPYCGPDPWDNVVAWIGLLLAAILAAQILHSIIEKPFLTLSARLRRTLMPKGSALMPSPTLPLSPLNPAIA